MARKIPCQYCKQRRRKCERSSKSESCERCTQMKRKCISQDFVYKTDSSDDDELLEGFKSNSIMEEMNQQVKDLELELKKLDIALSQQKALVKKEPVWNITFENGQPKLGTEIKTLEEMMMYGNSVMRYLSPFGATFKTSLKFERSSPSFIKSAMRLVSRLEFSDKSSDTTQLSHQFSAGLVQFINPRSMIKRLVDTYFNCFNDSVPILHKPSYLEHFNGLEDPMTDPVTLAICAGSSISTCKHSIFNSHEKRYIGEYFYKHAVGILTEIFDDPARGLEALLVINLLQVFMMTTLRITESRKWATVAVCIASGLKAENPGYNTGDASFPAAVRAKYATIHRNAVLADCALALMEFLVSNRRDKLPDAIVTFDVLPDEPQRIKDLLEMLNYILKLNLHPVSVIIMTQGRNMVAGEVAEVDFEDIMRHEEVVLDWWNSLPSYYKIASDPFGLTKEMIEKTTDLPKLLMSCYLYTMTLSIQGFFLQPRRELDTHSMADVVKDRAIHFAMKAADIILLLIKRVDALNTVCYCPSKLLIRSIDSIMTLISIKDKAISETAKVKLGEYMKELSKSISPDHQVSSAASPYSIISATPPGETPSVTELYKNYPLPGEALLFDVVNTSVYRETDYTDCLPTPPLSSGIPTVHTMNKFHFK